MVYALKRPYRKSAAFLTNDQTLVVLRKLKDNNGQCLWQPSLYYRVVVIRAPLQGQCYTVRDAVDWFRPPTT